MFRIWCTRLAVVLCCASFAEGVDLQAAGLGSGSSGPETSPARSDSAIKSISEIIESAGDLLLDLVKPAQEEPSLEDPAWNSLESPRHTVMTFLEAMNHIRHGREAAWSRVARTLGGTNELTAAERSQAESLVEVFDRIGPVRPLDLPGPEQVEAEKISRFEVFPYGAGHRWVWEALGRAPEGRMVLVKDADSGDWLFTRSTVQGAQQLRESMKDIAPNYDGRQSGQTFLEVFGPTFRRTPWWGWVVLLGAITAGVFAGRLVKRAVTALAVALEKRAWEIVGGLIRTFASPANLLAFTMALTFGLMFVRFTPTLSALRWSIIELLLLGTVGWLLFELIDLVSLGLRKAFRRKTEYTDMAVTLVRRSLRVFFIVLFIIFVLQNVLGFNIAALITGLGIVGLAVSLAGKDSARNLFGALTVFLNRPFVVGDWIRFQGKLGTVEDVGMQATRLRLASGEVLVVPNMQFIDHEVENLSLREYLRREMDLAITYGTSPENIEKSLALLTEILQDEEVVKEGHFDMEKRPPRISFSQFEEYALNLKVYYWYYIHDDHRTPQRRGERGWFSFLEHCSLVNRKIHRSFHEAGIEFAFPTRTLHWGDGDGAEFDRRKAGSSERPDPADDKPATSDHDERESSEGQKKSAN